MKNLRLIIAWLGGGLCLLQASPLPASIAATVRLPSRSAETVRESGRPLDRAKGVRFVRQEGNRSVLEIASGSYEFHSSW